MCRQWVADQLKLIGKEKQTFAKEAFGISRAGGATDTISGDRDIKVRELPDMAASLKMLIPDILDHELPGWRGEPLSANHAKLRALFSTFSPEDAGRAFEILQLSMFGGAGTGAASSKKVRAPKSSRQRRVT